MPSETAKEAGVVAPSIDFCTLGMFIIDEIHFPTPKPSVNDILGGAGSYSALGARIFSSPPASHSVGWIVDCGSDFPPELLTAIDSWETSCLIRKTPERLTTRGWNHYGENEYRAFKYLTPKLRLDADSLTSSLLASKSFHLICSPSRCVDLVNTILSRRAIELDSSTSPNEPLFIWEPVPDLCTPEQFEQCCEALKLVDVVSPNHHELASFFGRDGEVIVNGKLNPAAVLDMCGYWLESGIGKAGQGSVVVRCGASGCCYATQGSAKQMVHGWLPSYHQDPSKVVDPTGGGNTFLGGFAVGLVRTGMVEEAVIWGNIAASFAIEQVGMPELSRKGISSELWNGVKVDARLIEYRKTLKDVTDRRIDQ